MQLKQIRDLHSFCW